MVLVSWIVKTEGKVVGVLACDGGEDGAEAEGGGGGDCGRERDMVGLIG